MQEITKKDIFYMRKALALALRGTGCVHPNPLVGAVIVKNGRVIGEGWHKKFGGSHAEVNAIRSCHKDARGATLYVTLEPCAHTGKTPPCVDAILSSGIKKVVIGERDSNPLVNGRGIKKLKSQGIQVVTGVLQDETAAVNKDFNHWIRHRHPYGVIKIAQSLDGKIATRKGQSRWITGPKAREFSQELRAASDAILVGINTVLKDDPLLSVRNGAEKTSGFRQPTKVVLDSALRTPIKAKIFSKKSTGPVILATSKAAKKNRAILLGKKAEVLTLPSIKGRVDLKALFETLARRGIVNILIEGGGEVIADILDKKLARELYWFVAPILIGGKSAPGSIAGEGADSLGKASSLRSVSVHLIGEDLLVHGSLS